MRDIVTDLLGVTVEAGRTVWEDLGNRPVRRVEAIGIVRALYMIENTPTALIELVENPGGFHQEIGDLRAVIASPWDATFMRPVWRCSKCNGWVPRSELVLVEARLAGSNAVTAQHAAGFGCNKATP